MFLNRGVFLLTVLAHCHTWLNFVCRFSAVHLFLFDIDSSQWLSGLPQEVADKCVSSLSTTNYCIHRQIQISCFNQLLVYRITVHDGFSDPLGWDADKNSSSQTLVYLKNCSTQSLIDSLGEKPPLKEDRAVVVDSLSSLLLQQSPAAVCRMIHALGAYLHEKGPMGGVPYIGPRLGDGLIFRSGPSFMRVTVIS